MSVICAPLVVSFCAHFSTLLSSDWHLVQPLLLSVAQKLKQNKMCFVVIYTFFLNNAFNVICVAPAAFILPLPYTLFAASFFLLLLSCNWTLIISMPHCDKLVLICCLLGRHILSRSLSLLLEYFVMKCQTVRDYNIQTHVSSYTRKLTDTKR